MLTKNIGLAEPHDSGKRDGHFPMSTIDIVHIECSSAHLFDERQRDVSIVKVNKILCVFIASCPHFLCKFIMSGVHRDAIQKQIHQDWANRENIEVITASIKRITDFLNSFGEFNAFNKPSYI